MHNALGLAGEALLVSGSCPILSPIIPFPSLDLDCIGNFPYLCSVHSEHCFSLNTYTHMKAHTKAPKTTAAKSAKADNKSQDLKLPLAVYLRYRYRLALQANNLGKAKGLANRLAKMDEQLVVKGETFTTNAGALKFQESLQTPKATKAKTSTKSKAASTKQTHNLKDLVLEIMALNIDIADKATLLAKLV